MGEPISRLNPKVESSVQRVLLNQSVQLLLSIAMMLPFQEHNKRGVKPYDYRIILVLCILRILFRKTYADYETEMRFDKRLMEMLKLDRLPCKRTINNYALMFTLSFLSNFNKKLIEAWVKKPVDL